MPKKPTAVHQTVGKPQQRVTTTRKECSKLLEKHEHEPNTCPAGLQ